jgi:hypothetical protein
MRGHRLILFCRRPLVIHALVINWSHGMVWRLARDMGSPPHVQSDQGPAAGFIYRAAGITPALPDHLLKRGNMTIPRTDPFPTPFPDSRPPTWHNEKCQPPCEAGRYGYGAVSCAKIHRKSWLTEGAVKPVCWNCCTGTRVLGSCHLWISAWPSAKEMPQAWS